MCLAIPGQIVSLSEDPPLLRTARVRFGEIVKNISVACTPEAQVGQYVLVHVGLAISVIDETEARRVFDYLERMDELTELQSDGAASSNANRQSAGDSR